MDAFGFETTGKEVMDALGSQVSGKTSKSSITITVIYANETKS